MKKLSKIVQVTFFAAAFAVLFSGTADAYIDPSVMNYAIQAVAGVVIAVQPVFTGERQKRRSTRALV
jgi:hypothetical protein